MRYRAEYVALVQHSHFLRCAMHLAYDRHMQLKKTMRGLGFSRIPTERERLTQLQAQVAKEIGCVNTKMLLDAPQEIEKYHFGPLQIALSLLFAIVEKYKQLSNSNPMFQDVAFDGYCCENSQFVEHLESVRDSILHQRYDNIDEQRKFVVEFSGEDCQHPVTLLIEAERIYRDYLKRLLPLLRGHAFNEH